MTTTSPPTKLCIDCAHYLEHASTGQHTCGLLRGRPDIITGKDRMGFFLASWVRLGYCGLDYPRFWQPKQKGKT